MQQVVSRSPLTRRLVRRFVAGEDLAGAVTVVRRLTGRGLSVTVDHLGEDIRDAAGATAAVAVHRALIAQLAAEGLAPRAEVSLKLSSLGQSLDGELAFENALEVCRAAAEVGMPVTIDMEDHTTTDSTLGIGARLRAEHPSTGLVVRLLSAAPRPTVAPSPIPAPASGSARAPIRRRPPGPGSGGTTSAPPTSGACGSCSRGARRPSSPPTIPN